MLAAAGLDRPRHPIATRSDPPFAVGLAGRAHGLLGLLRHGEHRHHARSGRQPLHLRRRPAVPTRRGRRTAGCQALESGVIVILAAATVALPGNIALMRVGGSSLRSASASDQAELAAVQIVRDRVAPQFVRPGEPQRSSRTWSAERSGSTSIRDNARMRAVRIVALAASLIAVAWFALGARQAHELAAATNLLTDGKPISAPDASRASSLLNAAGPLNPDQTVELLRAKLDEARDRPGRAQAILLTVVRKEPENLEAWFALAQVAGNAPSLELRAQRQIGYLLPKVPGVRSRTSSTPGS